MLESSDRWVGLPPWALAGPGRRPGSECSPRLRTHGRYDDAGRTRWRSHGGVRSSWTWPSSSTSIDVILISPTSAIPAFAAEGPMPTIINGRPAPPGGAVPFAMLCNMWGTPAISIPAGVTSDGLPVGIQIAGRRHADDTVLQVARDARGCPSVVEVRPGVRQPPHADGVGPPGLAPNAASDVRAARRTRPSVSGVLSSGERSVSASELRSYTILAGSFGRGQCRG